MTKTIDTTLEHDVLKTKHMFKFDLCAHWNRKHFQTCVPWNLLLEPSRSVMEMPRNAKIQRASEGWMQRLLLDAQSPQFKEEPEAFPNLFLGKNGHMAPSIAPCALFASDAFRIALRMIFIAISYLKFATIQNWVATCISAMKALLIGKEYNACDICDLF